MSQATNWSVPVVGPVSPTVMATRMDESLGALLTAHSGSARPSYAAAGTMWVSTATAGFLKYYFYDGTSDRLFCTVNTSTGAVAYADGTVEDIVGQRARRGHIYGLALSNNGSDATNDIDIAVGEAATDDTTPVLMTRSSTITKRLDAAWAVGNNQGGRDTGSIANTTYHVFLIQRSDTGVVDALFSTSATSPTMPTNYDRKRRIGSIIRSGGAILGFWQDGDVFTHNSPIVDVDVNNPGATAVTRTITAPTGIRLEAFGQTDMQTSTTSSAFIAYISDLSTSDVSPAFANGALSAAVQTLGTAGSYRGMGSWQVFTNTSAQIRSRLNASDANMTFRITTKGWIDRRGR